MYVNIFYTLYYNIIDCLNILIKLLTKIRTIYKVNVNGWKKKISMALKYALFSLCKLIEHFLCT